MHQPSFLEFLKAQYLRNFFDISLKERCVYIYIYIFKYGMRFKQD